jgi:hypothetical protein
MPLLGGVRRFAPLALWTAVLAELLVGIPGMARAYVGRQLAQEPAAPLIGYLATQQATAQADRVWVGDQTVLRHLTPYLGSLYSIRLADGERRYAAAASMEDLATGCGWSRPQTAQPSRKTRSTDWDARC